MFIAGLNHPRPVVDSALVHVAASPALNAPQCEALVR
jgi:hypothetical protein